MSNNSKCQQFESTSCKFTLHLLAPCFYSCHPSKSVRRKVSNQQPKLHSFSVSQPSKLRVSLHGFKRMCFAIVCEGPYGLSETLHYVPKAVGANAVIQLQRHPWLHHQFNFTAVHTTCGVQMQ
eukprot:1638472-Amphidinium_carterae.1